MGRIQKHKTNLSKLSLSACNARPVVSFVRQATNSTRAQRNFGYYCRRQRRIELDW